MEMIVTLCLILAALPLIGYLRTAIDNSKPDYLLNARVIIKSWHTGSNWLSRFAPIFSLLVFFFNLSAWGVYGFTSIFTFIAFLFSKLWWLIKWIWDEILHPVVFAPVKILWHYLVVWGFKFFRNAIVKIPESVKIANMKFALIRLLYLCGIIAVAIIAYMLTSHFLATLIGGIVVFFFLQYTIFISAAHYRSETFSKSSVFPGLKISAMWLAMAVFIGAILIVLTEYSNIHIVRGVSLILVQILIPIGFLFALGFSLTTLYLPAYISENQKEENGADVNIFHFLKTILLRFPKLLFSQIFQFFGIAILSIIPLIIIVFLNIGVENISKTKIIDWGYGVNLMNNHMPSILNNNQEKAILQLSVDSLNQIRDSIEAVHELEMKAIRDELDAANKLKDKIQDKKIHSCDRQVFVGENQSFSMPPIEGNREYEWVILNLANNQEIRRTAMSTPTDNASLVLYHRWASAGRYSITLRTKPFREGDFSDNIQVEVVPADSAAMAAIQNGYFASREAADYAINLLNEELTAKQDEGKEAVKLVAQEVNQLENQLDNLKIDSKTHINLLINKILRLLGLMLLMAVYYAPIWTYFVTYHYDMFSYEQEGKHYWVQVLDGLKAKNPNQPLLGIFVIVAILGILIVYWLGLSFFEYPENYAPRNFFWF